MEPVGLRLLTCGGPEAAGEGQVRLRLVKGSGWGGPPCPFLPPCPAAGLLPRAPCATTQGLARRQPPLVKCPAVTASKCLILSCNLCAVSEGLWESGAQQETQCNQACGPRAVSLTCWRHTNCAQCACPQPLPAALCRAEALRLGVRGPSPGRDHVEMVMEPGWGRVPTPQEPRLLSRGARVLPSHPFLPVLLLHSIGAHSR